MKRRVLLLAVLIVAATLGLVPATIAGAEETWHQAESPAAMREFVAGSGAKADQGPTQAWSTTSDFKATCYESPRTDPRDTPSLDVTNYGVYFGCVSPGGWLFPVLTADSWSDAALDTYLIQIDTDGTPATGCGGFEYFVVGFYDNGAKAGIVRTPSCDKTGWTAVAGSVSMQRPSTRELGFLFPSSMIGSPNKIVWAGDLRARANATGDKLPNSGVNVDQLPSGGSPPSTTTTTTAPGSTSPTTAPGSACASVATPSGSRQRYASSSSSGIAMILATAGLHDVRELGGGVTVFGGSVTVASDALRAAGIDADVGDDFRVDYAVTPNDPGFKDQWYLPAVGAERAWDVTQGSEAIVVAVLDSGVDSSHPELAGRLVGGWDMTTNTQMTSGNRDANGHGTATAGLVAAATNNGSGLSSLGWRTRVMPLRVGDANAAFASAVTAGIKYAADHGARVINLSLGSPCESNAERNAVAYAQSKGALVVASAGNERQAGNPVSYPAALPGVIGVAATTRSGGIANYSNSGSYVDIAAPGGSGASTAEGIVVLAPLPDAFNVVVGTSFSSPTVAAGAALVLAANPSMTAASAGDRLLATATDAGPPGRDNDFGAGILNMAAAVSATTSPGTTSPTTTTTTTTPATTSPAGTATTRLAGPDRIATSIAISRSEYADRSAGSVVLARADDFPDALAGGPLAASAGGPLLLTSNQHLDGRVQEEIARILPAGRSVHLVGGEGAVSRSTADALLASGYTVVRYAGRNRYETASLVSEAVTSPTAAFLVTGTNFPDGMSAGAAAGATGGVVLLTADGQMPSETAAYLNARPQLKRYAVGGPAGSADPGAVPITGRDRYETSANVARAFFSHPSGAGVASGLGFADALAGGAHVGRRSGPLLLTPFGSLPPSVRDWLVQSRASLRDVFIYGGTSSVSQQVESEVRQTAASS